MSVWQALADVRFTPQKQTSLNAFDMSALGQKRTFTPIVEFVYCGAIIAKSCRS
jgi:hypothetical protein